MGCAVSLGANRTQVHDSGPSAGQRVCDDTASPDPTNQIVARPTDIVEDGQSPEHAFLAEASDDGMSPDAAKRGAFVNDCIGNDVSSPDDARRVILLAGPPAAGKGTQCERLIETYGLVHVSPGEILRDHVRRGTPFGNRAKEFMDQGQLVPCDVIVEVVRERLTQPDIANRGCILDNFPLTAEQASAMKGHIHADLFILLDVPHSQLAERAVGRRLDPQTGAIYHVRLNPPPAEIESRVVCRSDDREDLVEARLGTYQRHIDTILPFFTSCLHRIDAAQPPDVVFGSIVRLLESFGWGATDDEPYNGSKAFGGRFSAASAKRAGFFSPMSPPELGDNVVCFRRGADWQKRGQVVEVSEEVSDGSHGLKSGVEDVLVTVGKHGGKHTFSVWSVFLAPVNDMEYSSICSTAKFQSSHFCQLYTCGSDAHDAPRVRRETARTSLQDFIQHLEDADGEPINVSEGVQEALFSAFDTHDNPSLFVYSMNFKLGPRSSVILGLDFSYYYRALNNTLNNDREQGLRRAMPLIQHMVHDILYAEDGQRRYHQGGRVWKGDIQRPVPLNVQKLMEAAALGTVIRFRQFQSTSSDEKLAAKYRKRDDSRGFLWTIDIPEGFWGARDIAAVAWRHGESETLFPPYAAFLVKSVDAESCHLQAVEKDSEIKKRADRHGLRGSAVELINY
mmetsp:Transcript_101536/g.286359  ORF Transcript_101536/g.286359 Transcript_101536/m.286359 type:complete len:678 (+) Transcript_101536:202-2235(+)